MNVLQMQKKLKELLITEARLDLAIVQLQTFNPNGPGSCADRLEAAVEEAQRLIRDLQGTASAQARRIEAAEAVVRHYADEANWRWCREHYDGGTDGTAVAREYLEKTTQGRAKAA